MIPQRALARARSHGLLIAVLATAALIYAWRLGDAPIAVSNDEAHFSAHGYTLATTGRDLSGVLLPLFIEMIDPLVPQAPGTAWWQPLLFYLTGLSLSIFPMTEWAIRAPVVLIGVASIALIYAIVLDAFGSRALALASAVLMALTPALFIMSRQAIDYLCPVPFVLGWLWCLGRYFRDGRLGHLAAGGALLGFGAWSHISGWALAPVLAAVTVATLIQRGHASTRPFLAFAAGALVPLALTLAWLWFHPGVTEALFARYGLTGGGTPQPSASPATLVSIYFDYFNPSFLFFAGGAHPTQTTSRAGVFLLPLALLIPAGLHAARSRPRPVTPAWVWGFLLAPLPVVAVMGVLGEDSIGRVITLIPFGVLIAAHGVDWLWHAGRGGRAALALAAVVIPIQFAMFLGDYHTDYQRRAAPRFDALNTRAVADFVITYDRHTPIPAMFLSDDHYDSKSVRWRFHLWKAREYGLWERTRYFADPPWGTTAVPIGSLLAFFPDDERAARLLATGDYQLLTTIAQPGGDPASIILTRTR